MRVKIFCSEKTIESIKRKIDENPRINKDNLYVDFPHNPNGNGPRIRGDHGHFATQPVVQEEEKPYKRDPIVYVVILGIVSVSMSIGILIGRFL